MQIQFPDHTTSERRRTILYRTETSNVGTNRSKESASGRNATVARCAASGGGLVEHYSNVRLNSAIGYITPKGMLVEGSMTSTPSGSSTEVLAASSARRARLERPAGRNSRPGAAAIEAVPGERPQAAAAGNRRGKNWKSTTREPPDQPVLAPKRRNVLPSWRARQV